MFDPASTGELNTLSSIQPYLLHGDEEGVSGRLQGLPHGVHTLERGLQGDDVVESLLHVALRILRYRTRDAGQEAVPVGDGELVWRSQGVWWRPTRP